jgi:PQQ-dependent dehydrogenase (methanol/ethanol family)
MAQCGAECSQNTENHQEEAVMVPARWCLYSLVLLLPPLAYAADPSSSDWSVHGHDDAGTRFSPLAQINAGNVKDLGLAWSYSLDSTRGVESTPLVVNGVMYVTAPWSIVHALDARTGKGLWVYDPQVPRTGGYKACCDVVNRGVAVHEGKVYVASLDGRLIAIDAASGKKAWERDTIIDHSHNYTVTGAPRVVKGKVIIGNGGAEMGVRGYVTAYDAKTGKRAWRWFAVPGDPALPYEDESMAKAAKTWDPSGKYWENGGGGTVWNSMVYDAQLNLLYLGTGNGAPWARHKRSPSGGDNLYLASIVALDPDTGKYVWHYQETPGDNWDYTSAQDLILADIKLDGKPRKVILHAPKNGFFFVIDRTNGKFISADKYVDVSWATGYDKDGRPLEIAEARSADHPFDIVPGPYGGHNWQSMAYSPLTGLAYFPAQNVPLALAEDPQWTGHNSNHTGETQTGTGWNLGFEINPRPPQSQPFGRFVAWDPIARKQAWAADDVSPWNGGALATAGDLVFEGTADARLIAYNAHTGEKLWDAPTGTGVIAAPISYELDGKEYISIAAGWGGAFGLMQGAADTSARGTVYTYVLGGKTPLPEFAKQQMSGLLAGVKYDPKDVPAGTALYVTNCVLCHGVPAVNHGGNIPNLGYVDKTVIDSLGSFVFNGPFVQQGMPDFTGKLAAGDVDKLKAFIQGTADAVRPQQK